MRRAIADKMPGWHSLSLEQCVRYYESAMMKASNAEHERQIRRTLCRNDLFYLLAYETSIGRRMMHPWLYGRCRMVEAQPNGYLDLWAREHYKSTIITFGKTLQDVLIEQEKTFGFFSHTRPISKAFLKQLMNEMEQNEVLKMLFPEVLWSNPRSQAPVWSLDGGIVVKRQGNPKEATIEAWGLVDGQPTSKHFDVRVYDDVVTQESVNTPDQIEKTTSAWELSDNLGKEGGVERYSGTRYHLFDTYATMLERKAVVERVFPACPWDDKTGPQFEAAVLMAPDTLREKYKKQGTYTFGAQMLLNPTADKSQGFRLDWIRRFVIDRPKLLSRTNRVILVDPASSKKKTNTDYTAIWVLALGMDSNYYLIDGQHDKLNLTQRADAVIELHKRWSVGDSKPIVGYEEYGLQADIEFLEIRQQQVQYRFDVVPLGGSLKKEERIKKLVPMFEGGRVYFPDSMVRVNAHGEAVDILKVFVDDEYRVFPVCEHDDQFDCLARVLDPALGISFPVPQENSIADLESIMDGKSDGYAPRNPSWRRGSGSRDRSDWVSH